MVLRQTKPSLVPDESSRTSSTDDDEAVFYHRLFHRLSRQWKQLLGLKDEATLAPSCLEPKETTSLAPNETTIAPKGAIITPSLVPNATTIAPKEAAITPKSLVPNETTIVPKELATIAPALVPNEKTIAPDATSTTAPSRKAKAKVKKTSVIRTEETKMKAKIDAFEKQLSTVVGLETLKAQLQSWAKQMLLDLRRRALGLEVGDRRPPHMAFLGNPGTGKTTVARMIGELLHMLGVISNNKVVEVQRSDLVAEYIGQTAMKTRRKVQEAKGGVLFVDEAYRLMPGKARSHDKDFGREALEEIMSFMDSGNVVVIFAGYHKKMQNVISANEGFRRRVTKFFNFDDFTCRDLADMACLKMSNLGRKSPLYGFRLHPLCTVKSIEGTIRRESTEEQRKRTNGGLVDMMLVNARENLDKRTDLDCEDIDSLVTITMNDLVAGLRLIKQHSHRKNNKRECTSRRDTVTSPSQLAILKGKNKRIKLSDN